MPARRRIKRSAASCFADGRTHMAGGTKQAAGAADMKALLFGCALSLALAAAAMPADAKGCIKGALIGGIAGHYASRHGFLGAAAGCVVGHHLAKRHRTATQNSSPPQPR
jgi:hypothetical protein